MRARWALLNADIRFSLREVNLRKKPRQLLQISSKGTVPVLVSKEGEVIDESIEIMIWSLKKDPHNRLRSDNRSEKEEIKFLINQNDNQFKYHLDRFKYSSRYDLNRKDLHKNEAKKILFKLNERIADSYIKFESSWLIGREDSLADWALWPFVRQYLIADPTIFKEEENLMHLENWLSYFLNHTLFKRLMIKTSPWSEDDLPFLL